MNNPNSIAILVEYALEHCPQVQGGDSSLADCVETIALNGIQGIGEILENAAMGCGGSECTPFMAEVTDMESLASIGSLIENLAGVARVCSNHRVSLAEKPEQKT